MLAVTPDPKGHISYDFYGTSSTGKHVETHSTPVVAKSQEGDAGGQEDRGINSHGYRFPFGVI